MVHAASDRYSSAYGLEELAAGWRYRAGDGDAWNDLFQYHAWWMYIIGAWAPAPWWCGGASRSPFSCSAASPRRG